MSTKVEEATQKTTVGFIYMTFLEEVKLGSHTAEQFPWGWV
jgi:hypothetical protein